MADENDQHQTTTTVTTKQPTEHTVHFSSEEGKAKSGKRTLVTPRYEASYPVDHLIPGNKPTKQNSTDKIFQ